jgi:hypothetical protein
MGFPSMLDRSRLKVEAGTAAKLEYVRPKGGPISGQVVGLKEAGLPGALVKVGTEQATGNPFVPTLGDVWKSPVFDAVVTGPDGQFKTSRIPPGTYMVTASAWKPEPPSMAFHTGIRGPDFIGKVKVVVPEDGEVKPVRIEVPPLSGEKPAAPVSPATPAATPSAGKPAAGSSRTLKEGDQE